MTVYRGAIEDIPAGKYRLIYADPEWRFVVRSETAAGFGKMPQRHYRCSPLDEIKARPVGRLAASDCLLCLWATAPMLPAALDVMQSWGFKYVTGGAWAKEGRSPETFTFGTGYVLRSACEFFLLGRKGHPRIKSKSIRNLIFSPRREHSRKPDQLRNDLMKLAEGPYIELNARQAFPGWDAWGNEIGKFGGADE